jgi:lipopolysaccharide/colanic/teichoic acid biosynthesis glycosyltransferase
MEPSIDTTILNTRVQKSALKHQIIFVSHELDFSSIVDDPANKSRLYDCHFAFASSDVMDRINQVHPHDRIAVVINARWAEGNHMRLLRKLAAMEHYTKIPVLVVSDRIHLSIGNGFIEAGADDHFKNPITFDQLEQALDFFWENKKAIELLKSNLLVVRKKKPISYKADWVKRGVDILGASAAILILSPIFALAAVSIKLESAGPIFYRSNRVGANGQTFDFWKFRSMYDKSDERLGEIAANNQYGPDARFVKFTNDPRVTRTGRIIRKYSIDELPQLYNVLKGDMSLVGNRPLPEYEADSLLMDNYSCQRFMAPAGITGLWQVSKRGKSEMSADERIQLDVEYTANYSIAYDMKLLFKTTRAFIQKENV